MKMEAQIRLINIEAIIPNRFQPRLEFDEVALRELADSIKEHGIFQPLVVRRVGDRFEIIAGERRYKAAQLAGLTAVPCIISDLDDNESAEVAIIENTHRKDLSPIEEAKSYKKLLDRQYVTQDQLAKRLGISQSNIANKIRLLNLDESVQEALTKEKISERHARSLLKITDKIIQEELLNKIISERWTVKNLDEEIDIINNGLNRKVSEPGINTHRKIDVDVDEIVNNSIDILGPNPQEMYSYQKNYEEKQASPKKNSLFFNNLENEEVNMDPTLNFGFNPFKTPKIKTNEMLDDLEEEEDYELLSKVEEEEDKEEEVKVVEKLIEPDLDKNEDVIEQIKKMLAKAKTNGLGVEAEEFNFNNLYQFVIRIDKEDK